MVIEAINKVKTKSSSRHDEISSRLLTETLQHIIHPLTRIINISISTGIVPDQLKMAKVIPILKTSENYLWNNYRPISLLPVFSKE